MTQFIRNNDYDDISANDANTDVTGAELEELTDGSETVLHSHAGGGGGGSGDVTGDTSSTDNAVARFNGTTGKAIQNSAVTIDDSGNIATSGTVDGRDVSADGTKLDTVETNADVTDTANVTSAGALMDSEVTNLAQVKAFDSSDYATAAQGATADSALQDVVDDTTPQLGGNLDTQGYIITNSGGAVDIQGASGQNARVIGGISADGIFQGGNGSVSFPDAGDVQMLGGTPSTNGDGGSITLNASPGNGTGTDGVVSLTTNSQLANLDTNNLTTNRNFSFPDSAGTFELEGHTHTESEITDLDHDATSIQGVAVDATELASPSDGDILVYRSAGSDFVLEAKPAGGANPAINDITDVTITTPADNEVLAYNSGTSEFINQTASEAGLASASHAHTASDVTDFDTEVSNNTDVAANTAARHDAVTVSDSAEIDFTLTGQDITASIVASSIDETKLDTSVNASLDLADSALQNVVEDTTPQLGGDLDGQSTYDLNNVVNADIEGYIDLAEIATPADPGANTSRIYAADEGGFTVLHYDDSSGVDLEIGRDTAHVVRNTTGATLTKGQVVYINGSNGTFPTVALADASTIATADVFGLVVADISNNSFGQVIQQGDLGGLDTSSFSDGDTLYLSTTAGAVTTTQPTGTDISVAVGKVIKGASVGGGIIEISISTVNDPGSTQTLTNKTIDADNNTITNIALGAEATGAVDDLSDVAITTPADNEVLAYDNGSGNWINQTNAEAGIADASHTHTESDISDLQDYAVGAASSTDNAIARYDGTTGKLIQNSSVTINDSGDITTSGDISTNGTGDVTGLTVTGVSSVKANTISEITTNSGVTVDSVLLKDGLVDGRDVATDGTKLDGIESGADVTDATNVNAAGATMNTDTDVSSNSYVLDEDDMASDSATKVATQQSIRAFAESVATGWVEAGETWTYASATTYSNTNTAYAGTFTISGDLTSKYYPGMRVKFDQTTDGTKYGIITKVAHAAGTTTVTVFLGTDYDMDNETISNPYYSSLKVPTGFNANPEKWTVRTVGTTQRTTTSSSFASLTDNVDVPIGAWNLYFKASSGLVGVGSSNQQRSELTLSTDGSTETNQQLTHRFTHRESSSATKDHQSVMTTNEDLLLTADTTYTMIGRATGGTLEVESDVINTLMRANCAYL